MAVLWALPTAWGQTPDATLFTLKLQLFGGPFLRFPSLNNPYCCNCHPGGYQTPSFSMGNKICACLHKHVICSATVGNFMYRLKVGLGCPTRLSMILSTWAMRSLQSALLAPWRDCTHACNRGDRTRRKWPELAHCSRSHGNGCCSYRSFSSRAHWKGELLGLGESGFRCMITLWQCCDLFIASTTSL